MAGIGVQQATDAVWQTPATETSAFASSNPSVASILTGPLPDDVLDAEVTVVLLFRGSLALNYMTGGQPHMTFSARCHRARRTSRSTVQRAGWHLIARAIDAGCGVLRGESDHCATAWSNHLSRGNRR